MIPVLSVALMRASDAHTIASGTPSRELMRRAGEGIVEAVDRVRADGWPSPVAVVCGSGNNAGDGYVVAAALARRGVACTVFLLSDRFSGDGAFYAQEAQAAGVPFVPWEAGGSLTEFGAVVDGIFGTGFRGAVEGSAADAIRARDKTGHITLLSSETYLPINRPMLIKEIDVVATEPETIQAHPREWYEEPKREEPSWRMVKEARRRSFQL